LRSADQYSAVQWFGQTAGGTLRESLLANGGIVVSGNEDDRHASPHHAALQFQPVYPWHLENLQSRTQAGTKSPTTASPEMLRHWKKSLPVPRRSETIA
jgi:hypothetical protein